MKNLKSNLNSIQKTFLLLFALLFSSTFASAQCSEGELIFNCNEIISLDVNGQVIDLTTIGNGSIYFDAFDVAAYNGGLSDGESQLATAIENALGVSAGSVGISVVTNSNILEMTVTGVPTGTTMVATSECGTAPVYTEGAAMTCAVPPAIGQDCTTGELLFNCNELTELTVNGIPIDITALGNGSIYLDVFDILAYGSIDGETQLATAFEAALGLNPGSLTVTMVRTTTPSHQITLTVDGLPAGTVLAGSSECAANASFGTVGVGACTNAASPVGQCADGDLFFNCDEITDLTVGGQVIDLTTIGNGSTYLDAFDILAYGPVDGETQLAAAIETALGLNPGTIGIGIVRTTTPSHQITMTMNGLPAGTTVTAASECGQSPTFVAGATSPCINAVAPPAPECVDANISTSNCRRLTGMTINGTAIDFTTIGNMDAIYNGLDVMMYNGNAQLAAEIETLLGVAPGSVTVTTTRTIISTAPFNYETNVTISGLPAGTFVGATNGCYGASATTYSQVGACGMGPLFKTNASTTSLEDAVINVFPNPTVGTIEIESIENVQAITIFSIDGKVIEHKEFNSNEINGVERFDLSNQPTGLYNIIVKTDSEVQNYKIVKQ